MKKAVAFLLAFLIFVAPMTTFVKADVVIGDNDETIVNENATILGRKLALLESFSDLALSGVTEFSISNATDVDTYLDNLWSEVNDAIDALNDGSGFTEISDTLKSRYYNNLITYRDFINNRGDYLSYTLQNPSTNLLSTFFADNIYGKETTQYYGITNNAFKALSHRGTNIDVYPDEDYSNYLDIINGSGFWWKNYIIYQSFNNTGDITFNPTNYTWYCDTRMSNQPYGQYHQFFMYPLSCYIVSTPSGYTYTMSGTRTSIYREFLQNGQTVHYWIYDMSLYIENGMRYCRPWLTQGNEYTSTFFKSESKSTLDDIFNALIYKVNNVNIYVDGVPWSIVYDNSSNPTLDIDGYLTMYGNDNPQQYQLQQGTQIDYDQLYQVIYNAIRDNLPISQGDINYYDSHDTIYSPTIINNYGDEEGDESDLIDTILDYAVIPKFDTSIAQPMRAALTNGVVIMNNSITNVIPQEILIIFGACFFLLLFAVVINRMIK